MNLAQIKQIAEEIKGWLEPCGNDMLDASVENLMDSKAAHRFTTIIWISALHLPTLPQVRLLLI